MLLTVCKLAKRPLICVLSTCQHPPSLGSPLQFGTARKDVVEELYEIEDQEEEDQDGKKQDRAWIRQDNAGEDMKGYKEGDKDEISEAAK